ncbi:hypothetical protein DSECCO2_504500 [anaerobic digester metagenome]
MFTPWRQGFQIIFRLFPENIQVPDSSQGSESSLKTLNVRFNFFRFNIFIKNYCCCPHPADRNAHVMQVFYIFSFSCPFFVCKHLGKLICKDPVSNKSHGVFRTDRVFLCLFSFPLFSSFFCFFPGFF